MYYIEYTMPVETLYARTNSIQSRKVENNITSYKTLLQQKYYL